MEFVANLELGFSIALSWNNLLYCLIGVVFGTFIGVLPGLGAVTAIAMLLPFTFGLEPVGALIMLSGIFYGALYGGSTATILLNLPGTPASAVIALDGYPMAQQGRAGVALFMTTVASFVGGIVALVAVAVAAPSIVKVALSFGAPEYFSMMFLGLIAAAATASNDMLRSIGMVLLGILMGLVGMDIVSGARRFIFGIPMLSEGLSFIVVAMAFYGLTEVVRILESQRESQAIKADVSWRGLLPKRDETKRSVGSILRGTGIGSFLGALPGAGPTISSFMAYMVEIKVAKDPKRFGKGAIEGVVAPEAANNAAAQTGYVPTLALGIPGDAVGALILGTLVMHGIAPGPRVIGQHPDLFWGLLASMLIGNILLLVVNIPFIGVWVRMLSIPYRILFPAIIIFLCVGVFSVANSPFQVILFGLLGIAGYIFAKLDCPASPLLLGLILGPMMEENLRRSLLISRGDPSVFIESPISAAFLGLSVLIVMGTIFSAVRRRRRTALMAEAG